MDNKRIVYLLEQYAGNTLSAIEEKELLLLLTSKEPAMLEEISALLEMHGKEPFTIQPSELQHLIDQVVAVDAPRVEDAVRMPKLPFFRKAWFRYAAAAMLIVGIGAYLWQDGKENAKADNQAGARPAAEILPGKEGAILTLADGRIIVLDSMQNGVVANQMGTQIVLKNGLLAYNSANAGEASYNTMTTPKGRQFKLLLPDESAVWLNATSSITYPTSFSGNTREVVVTGEVYFEVAKNPQKPFIVKAGEEKITVTGTSFNVNSYADEPYFKTTLVEGAVKINDEVLRPGEAYMNGKIIATNVEQDLAWKNGVFNFDKMPIEVVMRQLARWYDITVEYEEGVPDVKVGGEMGMDLNLSQVLNILSDMEVKYRLEGRNLIIKQ